MGKPMDKWRFIAGKIIERNGEFSTFEYQRGCVNRFLWQFWETSIHPFIHPSVCCNIFPIQLANGVYPMSSRCQTHPNGWEEPRDMFDTCQWLNHLPKNMVWTFFERESVFFLLAPSRRRAQDLPDSHECTFGRGAREWSHHRKDRKVESDKQFFYFSIFLGIIIYMFTVRNVMKCNAMQCI